MMNLNVLKNSQEFLVVGIVISVLGLLFTPIPPIALDILLIANISLALTILLITFQTDKPLQFSTFPSILLIATLFRLSLNVSATRLILDDGYAGKVIEGIGKFVVGGNFITGMVVFFILIVIQYVVVTNGAQRVAEVAARFTLDSMPGKQMSIDADLNMGIIDQEEAKTRRASIEKEANFYGAMDGASKFVKGDAIAGIIIIFINIIGGLSIAIFQKNMSWADALHRYTLLTVGDGIVTQIPSLIIAVATGIIITRATTDLKLGQEIVKQILSSPKPLIIVAISLLVGTMIPSMPIIPLVLIAALFLAGAWISKKMFLNSANEEALTNSDTEKDSQKAGIVQVLVGTELSASLIAATSTIDSRLDSVRKKMGEELGFPIPKLTLTNDSSLSPKTYAIKVAGATKGRFELHLENALAISTPAAVERLEGLETKEPTYGITSYWIENSSRSNAKSMGYTVVDPETVLVTHITEIVRKSAADLLSRKLVEALILSKSESLGSLSDELIPSILSYSDIQKVLQLLLQEQVAITNLEVILEVLVDKGRSIKNPEELAEHVRERLGALIAERFTDSTGTLHVITLSPSLERRMTSPDVNHAQLTSQETDHLFTSAAQMVDSQLSRNVHPVIVCSPYLRRTLRRMFAKTLPHIAIMSMNELSNTLNITSAGMISVEASSHG